MPFGRAPVGLHNPPSGSSCQELCFDLSGTGGVNELENSIGKDLFLEEGEELGGH